jgi:salicylate biosynthesis isochorismate synthase/menaquinone-specific isochorismate synthase
VPKDDSPLGLAVATAGERLAELVAAAEQRTQRRLASVTVELEADIDPAALVFGSRLASDRWFCWEQPDRGFALAGLGSATEVVSRGPERFRDISGACAELLRNRLADEPSGLPAGVGPVWVGGFTFAPAGGRAPHWSSLPPALMVLPEVSLVRVEGRAWLTLSVVGPGTESSEEGGRVASLRAPSLPLLDPSPTGRTDVSSVTPPAAYEAAVAAATERINAGELEKVVLAREVAVEAPAAHDPAALFGALREAFPSCFSFCVGTPQAAFVGASPELLVRRTGAGISTVALAGSTRRSADPSVDDHLGEQLLRSEKDRDEHDVVVKRIERSLRRRAVWVQAAAEPELVKVANIQHLATPIHAQLAEPLSAVELAATLHPTPAVGGEPGERALAVIDELEDFDRGWYAAPVGWMDATEDGEFCVAIRSVLLRDRIAHLYAGNGIVGASDPAAELAETEVKLDAILPLLAG